VAHIQKRGDGRWRARYRGPDHREHSRTFQRKSDAERFLASIESRKNAGEWIDPRRGRMSFDAWVEMWAKSIVHLKPKTLAGYESLLNCYILPSFGNVALARIEPVDIREWVAALIDHGLSPSRVRQAYQLLSAVMKSAVESEYIARTPCIGVKLPRTQSREMQFLSADQVEALAESTGEFSLLVYVLAYTGIRWGEAVALRRARCDLLRRRLHIIESMAEVSGQRFFGPTKTYQRREVGVPAFLAELLAEHLATLPDDPDALVFTSANGQPLSNANFRNRVWLPALRDADLPHDLRIHDLRHTCASLLIAQGTHPKAIQAHLGHSSITVTLDRYGHLFPNALDDVARGLDAQRAAAYPRPGKSETVIDLTEKKAKAASDQQLRKWGRLDSNQRPTDYESAALTN
jgi:integrase